MIILLHFIILNILFSNVALTTVNDARSLQNNTETPSVSPTALPTTNSPTDFPTESPTKLPTSFPTLNPTFSPTLNPTQAPTLSPSFNPTIRPTNQPTLNPTSSPTASPTPQPTANPTKNPTTSPTTNPTINPTLFPTVNPTENPSINPTVSPTQNPTLNPTQNPTLNPTISPTKNPTLNPTKSPTTSPTINPTSSPTKNPTTSPTRNPTTSPTENPTFSPTTSPTVNSFLYRDNNWKRLFYIPLLLLISWLVAKFLFRRTENRKQENVILRTFSSDGTEEGIQEDDIDLASIELDASSLGRPQKVVPNRLMISGKFGKRMKIPSFPKFKLNLNRGTSDIELIRTDEIPKYQRKPSGLFVRMSNQRNRIEYGERRDSFTSVNTTKSFFSRFSIKRRNSFGSVVQDDARKSMTFDNQKHRSSRRFHKDRKLENLY